MSDARGQSRANAAFVRMWTKASRRVHAYILTMVTNHSDAEDLLQEVGVTAWEKFEEYDPRHDFTAWACGIAHFKVLAHYRSSRRLTALTEALLESLRSEMALMGDLLERQHQAVQECLSALSPENRRLIRLRYTPGLSIDEIAVRTGRSVAATYKALQRLHDQLFRCASRKLSLEGRP